MKSIFAHRTMWLRLLPATMLLLTTVMAACVGGSADGGVAASDSLRIDTMRLADTSSFIKAGGERVGIYAEAVIAVPVGIGDDTAALRSLQRWFVANVLAMPDSLPLSQALQTTVGNSLHQYDLLDFSPDDIGLMPDECSECEVVYKYNTSQSVSLQRNDHGLVTFARVDVVKKNDRITSVAHHYYTYDLSARTTIDLAHLLREDAIADVTTLVRQQLLKQNNVTTADQLGELGFFNVDNLWLTSNFVFGADGLTWSYPPGELAVDAIGEPTVTLPYDVLLPYAADDSPLRRF